jgi:hypothetical protein
MVMSAVILIDSAPIEEIEVNQPAAQWERGHWRK